MFYDCATHPYGLPRPNTVHPKTYVISSRFAVVCYNLAPIHLTPGIEGCPTGNGAITWVNAMTMIYCEYLILIHRTRPTNRNKTKLNQFRILGMYGIQNCLRFFSTQDEKKWLRECSHNKRMSITFSRRKLNKRTTPEGKEWNILVTTQG